MAPGEKPKEFKKTLKRLAGYLKPRKYQLLLVAIAAILSTLFNVITPKLLGDATSSIFSSVTKGTSIDFTFLQELLITL
ncbi:ABC transporter ATP-binding protein, partial [Butyricicoccus sp. 1XD8-22]